RKRTGCAAETLESPFCNVRWEAGRGCAFRAKRHGIPERQTAARRNSYQSAEVQALRQERRSAGAKSERDRKRRRAPRGHYLVGQTDESALQSLQQRCGFRRSDPF